jgi:signal transduction histidine kinase
MIGERESTSTTRWLLISGAAVVVLAMAWISWQVLRLEERELRARHAASFQESLRLALWRMDSTMTPILAREAARPYFEYQSFYPANRAYTSMLSELNPGDVLVPSPLLTQSDERVVMNYQFDVDAGVNPASSVRSPQVPTGLLRSLATGAYMTPYALQINDSKLAHLREVIASERSVVQAGLLALGGRDESAMKDGETAGVDAEQLDSKREQASSPSPLQQDSEYAARQRAVQNIVKQRAAESSTQIAAGAGPVSAMPKPSTTTARMAESKLKKESSPSPPLAATAPTADEQPSDFPVVEQVDVQQGDFLPRWIGARPDGTGELVFERTVNVMGKEIVQGFQLDWPKLAEELVGQVSDLFPMAKLEPVAHQPDRPSAMTDLGSTMLATIPVRLVVDAERGFAPASWSPLRSALVVVWVVVSAAVVGLVLVVRAATQLAERRGRFVSAVTHELRTPLTTFRLYAQMLADGMVKDDEAKAQYARTLERESGRLATIVESVLEYARLGPGKRSAAAAIPVGQLCDAITPVLESLARRGGLCPHLQFPTLAERALMVRVLPAQIERIATNLVDNAVKYATSGDEPRLDIAWSVRGNVLRLVVRDYGPGVPDADRVRIFRPFERGSASEQGTIPGLGLGLALASDLARQQGGALALTGHAKGAEFTLELTLLD